MTTALLLTIAATGSFKCAVPLDPLTATSADEKTKVVLEMSGKVLIYTKGSKKPHSVAGWSRFGHHLKLILSPDGSTIAIVDDYAGMEVLDGKGNRKAFLKPALLMSKAELEDTPHQWACHPEGQWIQDPAVTFSRNKLTFTLYNGRKVNVPLQTPLQRSKPFDPR